MTSIDLSDNKIGVEGAKALSEMLEQNKSLVWLELMEDFGVGVIDSGRERTIDQSGGSLLDRKIFKKNSNIPFSRKRSFLEKYMDG